MSKKLQHRGRRAAAVLLAAALVAACGGDDGGAGGEASDGVDEAVIVTLGANLELTGKAASVGVPWSEGLELAVEMVNDADIEVDGRPLRFEIESLDNQTDVERSIGNMQELIDGNVKFIFGPGASATFVPAYESLAGEELFVVTAAAAAAPLVSEEGGIYKVSPPLIGEEGSSAKLVDVLVEEFEPATVAILATRDDTGRINTEEYTKAFEANDVEVVYTDSFPIEQRDFASYITAMKAEAPDLVVVGNIDAFFEPFLAQSLQAGFTDPVFHGLIGVTGAASEGKTDLRVNWGLQTRDIIDTDDPAVVEWREAYAEHFGRAPVAATAPALVFYEPVLMLARAMEAAGTVDDLEAIKAEMRGGDVTDYPGRTLDVTFDAKGESRFPIQLAVREGSTVRFVDTE